MEINAELTRRYVRQIQDKHRRQVHRDPSPATHLLRLRDAGTRDRSASSEHALKARSDRAELRSRSVVPAIARWIRLRHPTKEQRKAVPRDRRWRALKSPRQDRRS